MIVLIGYMGSGKSSIGATLAKLLEIDHIDLDAYIEAQEEMSVSEIFKRKGEVFFRKKEYAYLKEFLERKDNVVLSLGGGTPCYGNNAEAIVDSGVDSFYLKASVSTLAGRLSSQKATRPLIAHLKCNVELLEFVGKHLFERDPYYRKAGKVIDVDTKDVKEIASEVIGQLQMR